MCVQYAKLGVPTDDVRHAFALERHHKMSAVVMGWVSALIVLLIAYEFWTQWWLFFFAIVVWVCVSTIGYWFVIPRLIARGMMTINKHVSDDEEIGLMKSAFKSNDEETSVDDDDLPLQSQMLIEPDEAETSSPSRTRNPRRSQKMERC